MDCKNLWFKYFCLSIKPKPNLTGSVWADTYRVIPAGTSPEPGKWCSSRVPYLTEIVNEATNNTTQDVVVMSASQIGKSELLLNTLGFFMHQEPSPILLLQPTVEMAEAFSKERIDPMIQASPALSDCMLVKKEKVAEDGNNVKKTSNTILKKTFIGGYLALVGSNAPAGLASRPIRVLLMDEVDRYGDTKEGDPVKLATQRTRNFHNRKIIQVSTPTFPNVKIHLAFEHSDKREFFLQCPHCHNEVVLTWSLVKWDLDADNNLDLNSIRINCPSCGYKLRDHGKINPDLLKTGKWKATASSDIAGFHLNALYSPWTPLSDLVREYINIQKGKSKKGIQEFYNLQLGLPYDPYSKADELWLTLYNQREDFINADGELPSQCLVMTAGADVQRDRIEVSFYAWGLYFENWLVDHVIIRGDPKSPETWQNFLDLLYSKRRMKTSAQKYCPLIGVGIDSGDGYSTNEVYKCAAKDPNFIYAIKGKGSFKSQSIPFVGKFEEKMNSSGELFKFLTIGVDIGKELVMTALCKQQNQVGRYHFPKHMSKSFFKQITAEVFNKELRRWVKIRERNEALDCAVYARAILEALLEATNVNLVELYKILNKE